MGKVEASIGEATIDAIAANPATADDRADFEVIFTFDRELPSRSEPELAHLSIGTMASNMMDGDEANDTVTGATDPMFLGTPNRVPGTTDKWRVSVSPKSGMDTIIGLSEAGMVKYTYGTGVMALTVDKYTAPATVTHGDVSATPSDDKMTVTLSGTIGANGFASIGYMGLPNLAEFFRVGGSITLTDAGATKTDHPAKTVVISEILWGLDVGEVPNMQHNRQFIELYNTSSAPIDLADWKLMFTQDPTAPANDVDQVSNVAGGGWIVDVGQSGRWKGTSNENSTNVALPINIISMYRNIDYKKVEKVKADGTADPNRDEQLKGVPDGNAKGSWKASTAAPMVRGIYESRGMKHPAGTFAPRTATNVPRSPFIISEVGNDSNGENDWVELQNVSDAEASLKNYQLSVVTGANAEAQLFHFHDKDYKVPAKGFIVVSSRHPNVTDLAAGKDVSVADDQEVNTGASHLFVVRSFNLPDSGKNLLILRNNHEGKHLKTANHIVDVIGTLAIEDKSKGTNLWPLIATGGVHGNVIDGTDTEELAAGKVYRRANAGGGTGEKHLAVVGYTGVGYDRTAAATGVNGGTPGYENGAVKDKIAGLTTGEITISEIMIDVGDARQNLPQWIELYNSSMTQAVSLGGWKLHLENASPDPNLNTFNATLSLDGMTISPNQTVLIVTTTGRVSDADHFPSTRLVNLWTTKKHREAVEMARRTDQVISMKGFNLTLVDKDNNAVDAAGNLDGLRRTRDEPAWALPNGEDDGRRSSLIRVYDDGVAVTGTMEEAWVSADETNFAFTISETYYGAADDYGTPGFRGGGPLPVSLSKFRPERLDTGEIVVRWITESELNNAGFNILRSETRNGEFSKINTSLIAGQGTTSERTAYEWKDKSAKPNVVYYYQIQDVSLDGKVQTLRQSRLKGDVSPAGKLTTTWGELKALQ